MTDTVQTPQLVVPENMGDLVQLYLKLRERIKKAEAAEKARLQPSKDFLLRINGKLLEKLNEAGGDGIKTPHGTAYRTMKRSATVADPGAFRSYVIDHDLFDLVDWKANAPAIDDFIKENSVAPPGINFSTMVTIGVRTKSSK